MANKTMDKRVLRRAIDAVHKYLNSIIKVIDHTQPSVVHSYVGEHCMAHVVSFPDTPEKLFVLCHYGDPAKAGRELGNCLLAYLGFMPEMPKYVRGTASNGQTTIPVLGFFVDKEEHEPYTSVQALSN